MDIEDNVTYSGMFVCLEGIDGAGKTLQAKLTAAALQERGYDAVYTQEPTHSKIGKVLREYLQDRKSIAHVDSLLFAADRIEHYYRDILPLLQAGKIVITDRYVYSSYAYQHFSGVPLKWIEEINKFARKPDVAYFIDVEVEEAVRRLRKDNREDDEKFESITPLQQIKAIYQKYVDTTELIAVEGNNAPNMITENLVTLIINRVNLA